MLPKTAKFRLSSEEDQDKTNEPIRFVVLNEDESDFDKQKIGYGQRAVHRLTFEKDKFIWQETFGSLAGLRVSLLEDYFSESDADVATDKLMIVAAEPGMGKSTLLTYRTEHLKTSNPDLWVMRINLPQFKELLFASVFNNLTDVVNFIAETQQCTSLAKSLLQYCLQEQGNVALELDGFDELEVAVQTKTIQLLRILKNTKITYLVVATRLHMKEELENALENFSYALKPLSEQDKKDFLKNFWRVSLASKGLSQEQNERFDLYINKLLKKFVVATTDQQLDFMGIPLQARMLAEAFQADFLEFYTSAQEKPIFPDNLDILALYKRFLEQKYEIYFKDKANLAGHLSSGLRRELSYTLTKAHQKLAFSALFPHDANKFLSVKRELAFTKEELKSIGIMQLLDGQWVPIHRTISEFLAADFLLTMLSKPADSSKYKRVKEFLLAQIFRGKKYGYTLFY